MWEKVKNERKTVSIAFLVIFPPLDFFTHCLPQSYVEKAQFCILLSLLTSLTALVNICDRSTGVSLPSLSMAWGKEGVWAGGKREGWVGRSARSGHSQGEFLSLDTLKFWSGQFLLTGTARALEHG